MRVLLIDDNDADHRFFQLLFNENFPQGELLRAKDSDSLDDIMKNSVHLPEVILVDLNLPGKDGRQILGELQKHPTYGGIPKFVWTSSSSPQDKKVALDHGVGFQSKPLEISEYIKFIQSLEVLANPKKV